MSGKKRKTGPSPRRGDPHQNARRQGSGTGFWLYGFHAARAALVNPQRRVLRAVVSQRAADEMGRSVLRDVPTEIVAPEAVGRPLPPGSVHQGVALLCEPLPTRDLDEMMLSLAPAAHGRRIVAVLDQITDPHNEGAILRSAAAFGVSAMIVQDRHAPPESGVLAKAASGALDIVPRIVTVNIARALEDLGRNGFWRIALAGDGEASLADAARPGDIALVFGAEGSGVRRLVRERCDVAARIPMAPAMESLNVSNAAAIGFYELSGLRTK